MEKYFQINLKHAFIPLQPYSIYHDLFYFLKICTFKGKIWTQKLQGVSIIMCMHY